MRKTLPLKRRGSLLIAAISGRALARAASEAGFEPLVADFFADADTQELAQACRKMPGGIGRGFQWRSLRPVLESLAKQARFPLIGLVYGSGFEDRTQLLARIAERWPLLGNEAATVEAIKTPERFFPLLDDLGILHPTTVTDRPRLGTGWLMKRRGGAGGSHVRPANGAPEATNTYYQALIAGRAVSVLFVANGKDARVLGFSEQWTDPAPRKPWRYGGAVRPAQLADAAGAAMTEAVKRVTQAVGLKGLGSADFVLAENQPHLLEINPRPGATLDIFANAANPPLALHVNAIIDGWLPRKPLSCERATAAAILYAPERLIVPRSMAWPAWAADLPRSGERIDKQRPICTLLARAGSSQRAKRLVETRKASLLAKLQSRVRALRGEEREQEEQRRKHDKKRYEEAQHQHPGRAAGAGDHR